MDQNYSDRSADSESSLSTRGSSWNGQDQDGDEDRSDAVERDEGVSQRPRGLSFSEHQQQQQQRIDLEYVESVHGSPTPPHHHHDHPLRQQHQSTQPNGASVPMEQERQILLLMLLAQVCALHDPTPRTFTVHVLELFERGILDRQSIHFLFELGLVPSLNTASKLLTAGPSSPSPPTSSTVSANINQQQLITNHHHPHHNNHLYRQRSLEVSAIRSTLEKQESSGNELYSTTAASQTDPDLRTPTAEAAADPQTKKVSWSAEHHPLSLSRYQREFNQVRLLSSGSFGQVFQATNKTDLRDYAIKRVPFQATGYSKESIEQVTREVQCLAACDHPHVVRYYTSWLESSWMTGSGGKAPVIRTAHNRLLMNGSSDALDSSEESDLLDYFNGSKVLQKQLSLGRRRRFSLDHSDRSASWRPVEGDDSDESQDDDSREYEFGDSHSVPSDDESDIFDRSRPVEKGKDRDDSYLHDLFGRGRPKQKNAKRQQQPTYRYQICLFIQMQLCHPSTLADWIRARNRQMEESTLAERLRPAMQIFEQVCSGLAHVHQRGIVHRDLKPANIFASQDASSFLIGDFGLSKVLQSTTPSAARRQKNEDRLLLMYEQPSSNPANEDCTENTQEPSWVDPLTAGVGTASYASPEQVASRSYGKEADIFSVGLILLELLCCFCTEHERIQTFHDCRYRRDLPDDIKKIPALAKTILQCTDKSPKNRPSADSLRKFALMSMSSGSSFDTFDDDTEISEIEKLKRQLAEKQNEVDNLKAMLTDRDRTIVDLREEVSTLRVAAIQSKSSPFPLSSGENIVIPTCTRVQEDALSSHDGSSSSDDEM